MAFDSFATENLVVVVNGRQITDWGETDPPFTKAYPNGLGTLRKGVGGGALRLDVKEPGQVYTLNIQPGSPDSAYLSGLKVSKATITVADSSLGSLEAGLGTQGMFTDRSEIGRGGQTITDDIFVIECNKYNETLGGE